jgi:hypothetical protein
LAVPIQFACQCGKTLKAAEEHAGKRAKCNQCGQVVTIPGAIVAMPKTAFPSRPSAAIVKEKAVATAVAKTESSPLRKPAAKPTEKFDADDFFAAELPMPSPAPKPGASRPAASPAIDAKPCPGCHQAVSSAAVICTRCGYNFMTGKKTATFSYSPSKYEEPPKKTQRKSAFGGFIHSRLTSGKLWSGVGMMVGAVVWFVVGLAFNRIFFYPPVLFIFGVISFFTGLIDGDNA